MLCLSRYPHNGVPSISWPTRWHNHDDLQRLERTCNQMVSMGCVLRLRRMRSSFYQRNSCQQEIMVCFQKRTTSYQLHYKTVFICYYACRSLSFVFVTTSFSLAFLSACYLLVDVVKVWNGGPFRIPGMTFTRLHNH